MARGGVLGGGGGRGERARDRYGERVKARMRARLEEQLVPGACNCDDAPVPPLQTPRPHAPQFASLFPCSSAIASRTRPSSPSSPAPRIQILSCPCVSPPYGCARFAVGAWKSHPRLVSSRFFPGFVLFVTLILSSSPKVCVLTTGFYVV